MKARCHICSVFVEEADQEQHLREAHPTPEGGFLFHYDARPYHTDKPSMMATELLTLVSGNPMYHLYERQPDGDVFIPQGCAVDLTKHPWFYSIPSATY